MVSLTWWVKGGRPFGHTRRAHPHTVLAFATAGLQAPPLGTWFCLHPPRMPLVKGSFGVRGIPAQRAEWHLHSYELGWGGEEGDFVLGQNPQG